MPFDALVYIIGEEPLYLRGSFSFMAGADGEREIHVLGYPISQLRLLLSNNCLFCLCMRLDDAKTRVALSLNPFSPATHQAKAEFA